ncbi:MAG: hypothetical protein MRY32_03550 [Rickettsiales bacterium]|nr:hypothetical protein [Rickettsiales bacterium]
MVPPKKPETGEDSNRMLRMVVIGMGLVLIGGTILLFVVAFQKMNNKNIAKSHAKLPYGYRECGDHEVPLADGERIEAIEFDEMIMRVTIRIPRGGKKVTMLHACTGEHVGSVTIK